METTFAKILGGRHAYDLQVTDEVTKAQRG